MASQWEYKLELTPNVETFAQQLNDQSEEGWELVTVVGFSDDDGGRSGQRVVFRREVTNPTWDQERV
jgi:hypothetical protein